MFHQNLLSYKVTIRSIFSIIGGDQQIDPTEAVRIRMGEAFTLFKGLLYIKKIFEILLQFATFTSVGG